ncbi:dihydroneopterin aldolase [Novosphingobium sp. FSY-8]|uniref:Dihydroneopterin aldolase n=1 Tax=Novosphingobium ovatum TaxID=1908523 RepID=A0ABW9XE05_9SPHN|nr:dihydroneopterin aldolase [Novosphingobium ovatum]NBC36728.1 dihydroneopterin aldolase [Novosphingobium ovatum]
MDTLAPLRPAVTQAALAYVTDTVVRLDGYQVMAAVGINRCEIGRRQPLVLWVELGLAVGDGGVTHLDQTVDYRKIGAAAQELAGSHIDLIETFGQRLGAMCLSMPVEGGCVDWARVRIDKPEAVDNGLASVTVTVRRA